MGSGFSPMFSAMALSRNAQPRADVQCTVVLVPARPSGLVARCEMAGPDKNANRRLAFQLPCSMRSAQRLAFCAGIDTIDGLLGSGT
jgi:hypothetical protein